MAELLVLAFDTFNPDPALDKNAWKLGHVIDIKPDGHGWGTQERLPKFFILKVPAMTVEECQKFLETKLDITNPQNPIQIGIRKWKFRINEVPTQIRDAILSAGVVTLNATQIGNYITLVTD